MELKQVIGLVWAGVPEISSKEDLQLEQQSVLISGFGQLDKLKIDYS